MFSWFPGPSLVPSGSRSKLSPIRTQSFSQTHALSRDPEVQASLPGLQAKQIPGSRPFSCLSPHPLGGSGSAQPRRFQAAASRSCGRSLTKSGAERALPAGARQPATSSDRRRRQAPRARAACGWCAPLPATAAPRSRPRPAKPELSAPPPRPPYLGLLLFQ